MRRHLGPQATALLLLISTAGGCAKKTAVPDKEREDQPEQAQQENAPSHRLGSIPKKKQPEGLSEKDKTSLRWFDELMELEDYIVAAMACREMEDGTQKKMCTERLKQTADELEKIGKDKDGDAYPRYVTELRKLLQGTESGKSQRDRNRATLKAFTDGGGKVVYGDTDRLLTAANKSDAQFSQFGCGYRSVNFAMLVHRDREVKNYTDFALTPANPLWKLEPDIKASYTPVALFAATQQFSKSTRTYFLSDRHRFSTVRTGQTADKLVEYINNSKYTKNHLKAEPRVLPQSDASLKEIKSALDGNSIVIALYFYELFSGWHYYPLVGYKEKAVGADPNPPQQITEFLAWNTGDATFVLLETNKDNGMQKFMRLVEQKAEKSGGQELGPTQVEDLLNRNGYKLDKEKMHFIVLSK
ncbi:MAG: hypothetical protein AAF471_00070 [Myxococcota bacterium]